ncbi:MAG: DUF4352 domain-containing protein [Euryarchaeota archaeon]|nr:MAG: hypothetical protein C5S48_01765 [ANME-2 cluster archaeon]MEA1864925.1 DUF4352 domain-containing protein [Euryarchaeota archaeon]
MNIRIRTGLTIIFVIALAVFFAGCAEEGEEPANVEATTPTPGVTPEEESATVPVPEPMAEDTPVADLNTEVGRAAKTSKISVKVISTTKTDQYDYYSDTLEQTTTEEAIPGKVFVIAEVLIKKVGGDEVYAGSSKFSMIDSEGVRYSPEPSDQGDDKLVELEETHLNQRMRGSVLFMVPEDANGLKIWYDFGDLSTEIESASWDV